MLHLKIKTSSTKKIHCLHLLGEPKFENERGGSGECYRWAWHEGAGEGKKNFGSQGCDYRLIRIGGRWCS